LQNQRCQRPFAALILEWLGNGHGERFILRLNHFRVAKAVVKPRPSRVSVLKTNR
jgi:hypothetical protein